MPIVSVIIPTYGAPDFLERAITSVLNQSFTDLELIVVDDNNPATEARIETEKIVKKFASDKRFHYIQHAHNFNGAVARNTGIGIATGKYIAFLDSDDEYIPERLQKCVEAMGRGMLDIVGVYTGCEFRHSGKVYRTNKNVKAGNYLIETLACTFQFCTGSNIFILKSIVDELDGFDGKFWRHQDYEFLVRVFEKYSLDAVQEVLVIKNNENLNLPILERMIDIKEQYLKKFAYLIKSQSEKNQRYIFRSHYVQIAEAALRSKRYDISREYYKKAVKQGGLSLRDYLRRVALTARNLLEKLRLI